MLYKILFSLRDVWFGFNVFRYITVRAVLASVTAFFITVILCPVLINKLRLLGIIENVRREHAPSLYQYHSKKEGTPTMGGIVIIASVIISTLLWMDLKNSFVLICLASFAWLGFVGFTDDYIKLSRKSSGLRAVNKTFGQLLIGLFIGTVLFLNKDFPNTIQLPFFKDLIINLGIFYIFFVALVIIASSNAVNLTDGLDGLAIGCVIIIALTYGVISYLTGHIVFSEYLNIFYEPKAAELTVFCASIFGSGLGFLWYNSYPAAVFMGDTGSLALGGAIGAVSVFIKKEILLLLVGGIFVVEALSVILQVMSFKLRKKRIFLMAPIHHHFQLKGWAESKIIIRFWIVAIILALLTLSTLKLR